MEHSKNRFETELQKFKEVQDHLKLKYPNGGYVVINGNEILGVWFNRLDALKEGINRYGYVPFLVKDIRENLDDVNNNVINFSRDIQFY